MNARSMPKSWALLALTALVASSLAGCGASSSSISTPAVSEIRANYTGPDTAVSGSTASGQAPKAMYGGTASTNEIATSDPVDLSTPKPERLVISNASMSIEVKGLDGAVSAVRALATRHDATISDLSVNAGTERTVALESGSGDGSQITPGVATVTLRVPAAKLAAAQRDAATLGRVVAQTASESDVTQQHVDMAARLKNLRAEERRFRSFLKRATTVSEMLKIEKQLSRVRGDIESMQAQLEYLERQAALATLTITLSEPGSLVSPAAGGWGFSAAVRDGVRAAAEVTRGLITVVLASSPLLLLVLLAVFFIGMLVRRSRRRKLALVAVSHGQTSHDTQPESPAADEPV